MHTHALAHARTCARTHSCARLQEVPAAQIANRQRYANIYDRTLGLHAVCWCLPACTLWRMEVRCSSSLSGWMPRSNLRLARAGARAHARARADLFARVRLCSQRRSWEAVSGIFSSWRGRRVWMPFYYDGKCAVRET
eukprot:4152963-Pleurochrysis_carterae.AAC.1